MSMQTETDKILDFVKNMPIDDSELKGQEVNEERLDWYLKRFDLFVKDGVIGAIQPYLIYLQGDSTVNAITRATILHEALNRQLARK